MSDIIVKSRTETRPRAARPLLYRVLLLNDDYTPRDFVVTVLRRVFRLDTDQARCVMISAHRSGCCVVAVYTREVAETKAQLGTEAGAREGYPLTFATEPEPADDSA